MAEYIKRSDVMKICEDYSQHCFNSNDSNGQDIADRILDDVVEIPTSDVEEVKRGKWIKKRNMYECSICSYTFFANSPNGFNYCTGCGADMRGVKK